MYVASKRACKLPEDPKLAFCYDILNSVSRRCGGGGGARRSARCGCSCSLAALTTRREVPPLLCMGNLPACL